MVLEALGDRTRRAILERLRAGPQPVVEIARGLSVGRPAVSQHLKVLKEASLVVDQAVGTRRVYQINPDGLRDAAGLCALVLVRGADPLPAGGPAGSDPSRVRRVTPMSDDLDATVRQSVRVDLPPDAAFRLFTGGIGEWWPLDEGYSYGGDRAREIFLEPTEGGRFYERFTDGDELQVGTVTVCSPPDRIVFTWRSPEWPARPRLTSASSASRAAPPWNSSIGGSSA